MDKLNVQALFDSIDGECNGFLGAGQLTTFIRLKGCNLKCDYCIGEKPARRRPRIITSNCSNKRISKVQVGDKLLAFDESFNLVETEVKEVFNHEVVEHCEIKIEGKPLLYTTLDHPFYTILGWKKAEELVPRDTLYHILPRDKLSFSKLGDRNPMKNPVVARKSAKNTDYGQVGIKVLKVRKIIGKPLKVYNFRCEPYSNYFVDYISVHNCDTQYAQNSKPENWMTIDEVIEQVHFPKVTITGGEPLLQKEAVGELCRRLVDSSPYHQVSIETNGTIQPMYFRDNIRYIVDFKLPSSGVMDKMNSLAFSSLRSLDVIKFVISDMEDYGYAKMLITDHPNWKAKKVFSPVMEIVGSTIEKCVYNPPRVDMDWPRRLVEMMIRDKVGAQFSLQIHKILWAGAVEER